MIRPAIFVVLMLGGCHDAPPGPCQSTDCDGSKTWSYETCGDGTSASSVLHYEYGDMGCTFTLSDTAKMTSCAEAVAAWCEAVGLDH